MVNLNADMGEGFGVYQIGNDDELLHVIRSANIACGFHAGDPITMRRLVVEAKQAGVSIGAHPGLNDFWGFGRRRLDIKPDDLESMVAYQIGALRGMARYAETEVTHVKPHGALNNMAAEDYDLAHAIGRAILTVDPGLIYVALSGSQMERAAKDLGLTIAREGFADRRYEADGNLTSRKIPGAVITDPQEAADQVVRMVRDGEITARTGESVKVQAESICIHGDEPTAVAVAKAARDGLEAAGIAVVTLTEMNLKRAGAAVGGA
jgi:UPF0271 protein